MATGSGSLTALAYYSRVLKEHIGIAFSSSMALEFGLLFSFIISLADFNINVFLDDDISLTLVSENFSIFI